VTHLLFRRRLCPPISTLFPYTTLFRSYEQTTLTGGRLQGESHGAIYRQKVERQEQERSQQAAFLTPLQRADQGIGRRCRKSSFQDRKSTRLNSSHVKTSYAVFCSKKQS